MNSPFRDYAGLMRRRLVSPENSGGLPESYRCGAILLNLPFYQPRLRRIHPARNVAVALRHDQPELCRAVRGGRNSISRDRFNPIRDMEIAYSSSRQASLSESEIVPAQSFAVSRRFPLTGAARHFGLRLRRNAQYYGD